MMSVKTSHLSQHLLGAPRRSCSSTWVHSDMHHLAMFGALVVGVLAF